MEKAMECVVAAQHRRTRGVLLSINGTNFLLSLACPSALLLSSLYPRLPTEYFNVYNSCRETNCQVGIRANEAMTRSTQSVVILIINRRRSALYYSHNGAHAPALSLCSLLLLLLLLVLLPLLLLLPDSALVTSITACPLQGNKSER